MDHLWHPCEQVLASSRGEQGCPGSGGLPALPLSPPTPSFQPFLPVLPPSPAGRSGVLVVARGSAAPLLALHVLRCSDLLVNLINHLILSKSLTKDH